MRLTPYYGVLGLARVTEFHKRIQEEKLKNAMPPKASLSDALAIKRKIASLLLTAPLLRAPLCRAASGNYPLAVSVLEVMIEEGYVKEKVIKHGATMMALTPKGREYVNSEGIKPIAHPAPRN